MQRSAETDSSQRMFKQGLRFPSTTGKSNKDSIHGG